MKKTRFKKHLKTLERLRIGEHQNPSKSLFLHRNERVVPFDAKTLSLLGKRIANSRLNLYPDMEVFYRKLARWLSIDEKKIYLTEGISGAIKSLMETLTKPGENVIFPMPTFALYPVYSRMFDVEYKTVGYDRDYRLDIRKMRRLVDDKTAVVFLPNPNVPIEGTLGLDEISALAEDCLRHGAFLAVDEVYFLFGGPTAIGLIDRFDNLFVMRSFSKAFGLAGIRLGYLIGAEDNIEYASKTRSGYETNTASVEVASFFIDNYRLVEAYIRNVKEGLAYLKKEFDKLGLKYNGGNTSNFIYVDMKDKTLADKIVNTLKEKGIHIRAGWPKPYSAGLCITGASSALMKRFIDEFKKVLKDIKAL
jgi:histidinol-phosphate aminotransferase